MFYLPNFFSALTASAYLVQLANGLTITLADTITLGVATSISYDSASTDPSNWLLRNVYANGTTQIGGVLSGTGTVSFTFGLAGPHFLQAVAYNETTSTATSDPFYTGNLFTPVGNSSSTTTSGSSVTVTSTLMSTSTICPSSSSSFVASSSVEATKTNNTGAIAGGVIGGVGFLAAMIFFGLWFRLRRENKLKPHFRDVVNNAASGNNGVIPTPLMIPAYRTTPAHVSSPTTGTDISSPIQTHGQRVIDKRRLPETPTSGIPTMTMASGAMQSNSSFPSESYSQHVRGDSSGEVLRAGSLSPVSREITELRREVEQLRQETQPYNIPPPSY